MKDVKYTLKAITKHEKGTSALWKAWCKVLWRDYLGLAVAFAAFAEMVLLVARKVAVPMIGAAATSGVALPSTYSVAEYAVMFVLLILVLAIMAFCSLRAHKAMLRVVKGYEKTEMSAERRNLLLVENTLLTTTALVVAFLPAFALFVSALAAENSMMAGVADSSTVTVSTMPFWALKSFGVTAFFGMLFVECVLTFVRLTFRSLVVEQNETQE